MSCVQLCAWAVKRSGLVAIPSPIPVDSRRFVPGAARRANSTPADSRRLLSIRLLAHRPARPLPFVARGIPKASRPRCGARRAKKFCSQNSPQSTIYPIPREHEHPESPKIKGDAENRPTKPELGNHENMLNPAVARKLSSTDIRKFGTNACVPEKEPPCGLV